VTRYLDKGTYCFGENRKYQLGLGHNQGVKEPTLNPFLESAVQVASGNKHTVALTSEGVFTWGLNNYGQLGLQAEECKVPTLMEFAGAKWVGCGWYTTLVLNEDNQLYMCGRGDMGQQGSGSTSHVPSLNLVLEGVQEVACGSEHFLAVVNNELFSWGWNEHGNLGLGSNSNALVPTKVELGTCTKVYAGAAHSFVLKE